MIFREVITLITGCAILLGILVVLARGIRGPSVYDRILAMNSMGTKTVLFVVVLGFIMKRPDFIDISLSYALINFVATIAILKYVEFRRLG